MIYSENQVKRTTLLLSVTLLVIPLLLLNCTQKVSLEASLASNTDDIFVIRKNTAEEEHTFQTVRIVERDSPFFQELSAVLKQMQFEIQPIIFHRKMADYILENSSFKLYSVEDRTILIRNGQRYTCEQSLNGLLSQQGGENDYAFEDYYGRGALGFDSYTFCSVVPITSDYEYKKGHWMFWSKDFTHIGSGGFQLSNDTLMYDNACAVYIMVKNERVDSTTWIWSVDQPEITELIRQLEYSPRLDTSRIEIPVAGRL